MRRSLAPIEPTIVPRHPEPQGNPERIHDSVYLAYVRDELGHHSISLTVDVYGHLIPGASRQAVDRLDDATLRNPAATGVPHLELIAR